MSNPANRRVSRNNRVKPWPSVANHARVESIGHAMDGLVIVNDAKQKIRDARANIKRREPTLTLLSISELESLILKLELSCTQIINHLENVPLNTDDDPEEGGDAAP